MGDGEEVREGGWGRERRSERESGGGRGGRRRRGGDEEKVREGGGEEECSIMYQAFDGTLASNSWCRRLALFC